MNILFLTQILPYPPDAGPRVKTWHVLRYLTGLGHRINLVSFLREEERSYLPYLEEICAAVYTVPMARSRIKDIAYWMRSNLSGRPFLIERDDLNQMRALVANLLATGEIDVIHADQLTMAQYGLLEEDGNRLPKRIFDAHNAVWKIVNRMKENAPWYLRPMAALEERRIKSYEGMILREFDHTLAVTETDREGLLEALGGWGGRDRGSENELIKVVPIAVDTKQLQPIERSSGSVNILTLGTLHYLPNADGVRWLINEVFPLIKARIPKTTLTVIGKNPPADFLQAAEKDPDSIEVTGYVKDLTPYLERAAVMAIAVRAGGGMRVRILEAFARGMPVVTTTMGLEGIKARQGKEVLVADSPDTFADAIIRVLNDPDLQTCLSANGRRLAEECYDWRKVLKGMEFYQNDHQPS